MEDAEKLWALEEALSLRTALPGAGSFYVTEMRDALSDAVLREVFGAAAAPFARWYNE